MTQNNTVIQLLFCVISMDVFGGFHGNTNKNIILPKIL